MSKLSMELEALLGKVDGLLGNGGDESALPLVLQDITRTALKENSGFEFLSKLIHALETDNGNEAISKMPLLYSIESVLTQSTIGEKERQSFQPILSKLFCLLFALPSKERIHLMLKILPSLISRIKNINLPLPASTFLNEASSCKKGANFDKVGSEMLCIIFNNPDIFAIDAVFVKSPDVWRIIRDGISQPGMASLRVMNSVEHVVTFCLQADSQFECNVVVDGETLFSWSKSQFTNASSFWQTFIALFTSVESSQSAHVIDPFLAKVAYLFSAWSSLNISEYWLELFCQRACNLGNFSVSKRFMHELLRLDFVTTNPRALKFLPKILAAAFTEHRFFTISHSPSSAGHFLNGDSFSEKLHPIFMDLCQLFKSIIYSNLPVETKREVLTSWFDTICHSVYSSPSLCFMLFACTQPFGTHRPEFDSLRIIDGQFLNQFRDTASSHMTASESEFKFIFGLSLVRMFISFSDHKSVQIYDLMRFLSSLFENFGEKERNYLLKTLFTGLLITNQPDSYSFETEFDNFMRRVVEQDSQFEQEKSSLLCNFFFLLVSLCPNATLVEKVTNQLISFIESVLNRISTNPYLPVQRVMFCVDLVSSAAVYPGNFSNWARQCLSSKCEDISLFFATQLNSLTPQSEKGGSYVWKKWTLAVGNSSDNFPYDPVIRTVVSLFEQVLASSDSASSSKICSLANLLLSTLKKAVCENYRETLTPILRRILTITEKKNSLLNSFRVKNILQSFDRATLIADFDKISENADVLGTNADALSTVFVYFSNATNGIIKQGLADAELNFAIFRAVEALFKQVHEIVRTAEPSWRLVLREFLETFMQRRFLQHFSELIPIFENAVEALHSISQSRHEIWQTLLCQISLASDNNKNDYSNGEACLKDEGGSTTTTYANLVAGILNKSLLFGPVSRRLRYFAESYYALRHLFGKEIAASKNDEFERLILQQIVSPSMIRVHAMRILSKSGDFLTRTVIESLISDCLRLIDKVADKRPFTNSQTHREKHRAMLAIVFLLGNNLKDGKNEEMLEKLWQLCMVKILPKEIFTSVRYLAEWCVVLLLSFDNAKNNFFDRLLESYDKAVPEQRYALMCCYIDIMSCAHYFLTKQEQKGDRLMKVFDRVLPACLLNHFITRARAQAALVRLWTTIDRSLVSKTVFDSRFLPQCIAIAGHEQNKPVIKNLNTFIYRMKDPLKDTSSLPILHFFLPKSCELFVDEFAFRCDFSSVELKISENLKNNRETGQDLWNLLENQFGGFDFSPKPDDIDDLHVVVQENPDPTGEIIQRKLTNWRKLLPNFDEENFEDSLEIDQQRSNKPCSDLILVASLIDKASNLGGLCRSADVFGLATVTLPSLDRVKDREFESLAVSAHKWLKIIEVPPHQLTVFLLSLKRDGYKLVAAEQATESVPLPGFKFPRKTALILGNEREGVPPNILQLVDTCVEIPQFGFAVRSLNVHVTGALFMYSYSSQHALKNE